MIYIENINDIMKIPGVNPDFFVYSLPALIAMESKTCGDITLIFCSDDYLLEINKKYLNHDYYTDVITFDYSDNQMVSGDLFISIDRVLENAKSFQVVAKEELIRVVCHGVLHLVGYKDKTEEEKKVMTSKENEYLLNFVSRETKE
ncbi:MAG: rRNA maturation RNase YbeY [Crocinitomicaceae bacterium]